MNSITLAQRVKKVAGELEVIAAEISQCHDGRPTPVFSFAQVDPLWSAIKLGNSGGYTIGSAGCALTCAAMVVSQVDPVITPATLQTELLRVNGFSGPYLAWEALPVLYPQLTFAGIVNYPGPADMEAVREALFRGPVVLWVDFNPNTNKQETHFVLGVKMVGDDITIIDPIDGYTGDLLMRYGARRKWTLARAIYGLRALQLKGTGSLSFSSPPVYTYDTVYP